MNIEDRKASFYLKHSKYYVFTATTQARSVLPRAEFLQYARISSVMSRNKRADIGIFGGSGLYSFLSNVKEVTVETPYGSPSDNVFIGEHAGKTIAFLPRHDRNHRIPPHKIN